jgi:hypothetical protein
MNIKLEKKIIEQKIIQILETRCGKECNWTDACPCKNKIEDDAKFICCLIASEQEDTHVNAYIIGYKDAKGEQKNWAIEKRKEYQRKLKVVKQAKPNSIQEQIVLGAKLRMLKEVIDQCEKNS